MKNKCISFLYNFDLIGKTPQLLIFGNNRYKSTFSSFFSIIITLFSLIFIIISLNEYFKYENPIVNFSKSSDDLTKRSISLKDTFLMFQLIDSTTSEKIDDSIAFFKGNYKIIYDNGSYYREDLYIEKCEFGKNINERYKKILIKKLNFGRPIEEFFCISNKNETLSLFYNPNVGYSLINLNIFINNISIYTPEKFESFIICENNIIDHNDKKKPISESFIYHTTSGFNSLEYTDINYNIQYIKYESDDGLFFKNNKYFSGISFSSLTSFRKMIDTYNLKNDIEKYNSSNIGSIGFNINRANYDNYKRSYQKIQSLLAEIMSVISIIFEIGKIISILFCEKKMSKDIIRYIINNEKKHILTEQKHNYNHNIHLLNRQENNKISSERKEIKNELMNKTNNTDINEYNDRIRINASKDKIFNKIEKKINNTNINNKILKEINYFQIIKSYFCFNDKKIKLINLCHNIISEDICIEKILKRIYDLENVYNYFTSIEKEKPRYNKKKRFKKLNKYLDKINNEIKSEN